MFIILVFKIIGEEVLIVNFMMILIYLIIF